LDESLPFIFFIPTKFLLDHRNTLFANYRLIPNIDLRKAID